MIKRGIFFKIDRSCDNLIYKALQPVNFSIYNWHVGSNEVYKISDGDLFNQKVIDGSIFGELIKNNKYLPIEAELKAFNKSTYITEIATYEDFLNSECEIILLIADCDYFEIYCKDKDLLEKIYENAEQQGYTDIEYIDENDPRTRMYIW